MGGQKAKIKNNALITQFFKKTPSPPQPRPALGQRHNDENALTESEIADQNRRALQRGGLGKKKKPVFRHALAQVVHEEEDHEGNDMRRMVVHGGLKNMENTPLPRRREPTFTVLSDNTDGPSTDCKKPTVKKNTVAMPKGWDTDDESSSVALDKSMKLSQKTVLKKRECTSNIEQRNPTPSELKCHNDATTPPSSSSSQPTVHKEKEPTAEKSIKPHDDDDDDDRSKIEKTIPNKRPVEDELLITTTRRKVLGPKPLPLPPPQPQQQQQKSKEEDMQENEERSPKIPHYSSFFSSDNDDSQSENENESANDKVQLSPLEFSISDSVSFPPVPRNRSSSPSSEESPDDLSTIPLTHPEQYEEHPAFPVPRGKSLVEKLGIKEGEQQTDQEEEESSTSSSPPSYII